MVKKKKTHYGKLKRIKIDFNKPIEPLIYDKVGFFLIGKWGKQIRVAFCTYDLYIRDKICTADTKKILKWIKDNKYTSRKDHWNYMVRELKKVKQCIKTGKKYVQP